MPQGSPLPTFRQPGYPGIGYRRIALKMADRRLDRPFLPLNPPESISMEAIRYHPLLLFVLSLVVMWLAARAGAFVRGKRTLQEEGIREDFDVVQAATLTLLGLIIGFSFSMAIGRYDQRKNLEEEEANAIGTAYVRADLLPAADGDKLRPLLRDYLDQRILFYTVRDSDQIATMDARTARLQGELWATIRAPAAAHPTPIVGLAVVAINDVINSQGYSQAAFWNRIPAAAWGLMLAMAVCANFLVGYGSRNSRMGYALLFVLPVVVAISFMLIADIDAPRRGLILVVPQNLQSLAESLRPR